jgi:hypothetical protein
MPGRCTQPGRYQPEHCIEAYNVRPKGRDVHCQTLDEGVDQLSQLSQMLAGLHASSDDCIERRLIF